MSMRLGISGQINCGQVVVSVVFNEIRSIIMGKKKAVYVLCIVYCVWYKHTMSIATIYLDYTNIERTALLKDNDLHLVNATIKVINKLSNHNYVLVWWQ